MTYSDTGVALVTGASSEIGSAIFLTLAALGYHLALTGRDDTKLAQVAESCRTYGVQALSLSADLADPQTQEEIIKRTVERFGRVDVLVHSAGLFDWAAADKADLGRYDELLNVSLRAALRITGFALPTFWKAGRGSNFHHLRGREVRFRYERRLRRQQARAGGFRRVAVRGRARPRRQSMRRPPRFRECWGKPHHGGEAVHYALSSSATVCPTEIKLSLQKTPFGSKA